MTRKQEHHENKVQPQFSCFCLVLPITNLKTFVVLQMMNAKMPRKLGRYYKNKLPRMSVKSESIQS